ncbi:Vacuolar calcium ion transporter [Coemansia sp. RSA 2610]|nr:Vacuolar calcium ion transporter [Coemansia sp. RSA 2610]
MPNIFNRLRRRDSLASSQAPIVGGAGETPPVNQRQTSSRNWGPRAQTYANNMSRRSSSNRRSTSQRQSAAEEGAAGAKEKREPAGLLQPWRVIRLSLLSSWINVLLLVIPVGIASHPAHFPDVAVFVLNFFAIVPLAKILGYATEQLSLHLGDVLGALINATLGNVVELLLGILALVKGEVEIVQTSLVGSIIANLLLVCGSCFFFGGLKNNEQVFNAHAAQSYGSLLAMAILSTILPAAYNSLNAKDADLKSGLLTLSHVTAIFMLVVYIAYLFFQLRTHANLFSAIPIEDRKAAAQKPKRTDKDEDKDGEGSPAAETAVVTPAASPINPATAAASQDQIVAIEEPANAVEEKSNEEEEEEDDEEEEIELTLWASLVLLLITVGFIGVCAEFLVDSIDGLTTSWNLSRSFVGMIILAIVGNASEHYSAISVAVKNKMDLALGVAVGSSIQIALFVMPVLCILGWIIDQPMSLYFSPFTTVVLFITVLLVNYIIGDGRTNWLEGLVLIIAYVIIGVAYFLYPKDMDTSSTSLG